MKIKLLLKDFLWVKVREKVSAVMKPIFKYTFVKKVFVYQQRQSHFIIRLSEGGLKDQLWPACRQVYLQ